MTSSEFRTYMTKKLNFVEDVGYFSRGFVRVYVDVDDLFIGHSINKNRTKIGFEHIEEWIRYFDRI